MSLAIELIERLAKQKTTWLKDCEKPEEIRSFNEVYAEDRKRKTNNDKKTLSASQ